MYLNLNRDPKFLILISIISGFFAVLFGLFYSFNLSVVILILMIINFLYSWKPIKLKRFIFIPQLIHFIFGFATPLITLKVFSVHHPHLLLSCLGWGLYFSSTSLTNELMDAKVDKDKNTSYTLGKKNTTTLIIALQFIAFTILNFSFLDGTSLFFLIAELLITCYFILLQRSLVNKLLFDQNEIIRFRSKYRNLLLIMILFWFISKLL